MIAAPARIFYIELLDAAVMKILQILRIKKTGYILS